MFIRLDLILVIYHIKETKFEKFCMMAFVRFYVWTFKQAKIKVFSKVHKFYIKKGFWTILVHMC